MERVTFFKPFGAPTAPLLGGVCGPHSFKNFRRVLRIPNMCLVLKLDNGKVVSIANEQTESQTDRIFFVNENIYPATAKTGAAPPS